MINTVYQQRCGWTELNGTSGGCCHFIEIRAAVIKRLQQGFTLIELMMAMALVGIITAVAMPVYKNYVDQVKVELLAAAIIHCSRDTITYYAGFGEVSNEEMVEDVDAGNICKLLKVEEGVSIDFVAFGESGFKQLKLSFTDRFGDILGSNVDMGYRASDTAYANASSQGLDNGLGAKCQWSNNNANASDNRTAFYQGIICDTMN